MKGGGRADSLVIPRPGSTNNLILGATVSCGASGGVAILVANPNNRQKVVRQGTLVAVADVVKSEKIAWENIDEVEPETGPHEGEPPIPCEEALELLKSIGVEFPPENCIPQVWEDEQFRSKMANALWQQRDVFTDKKIPPENRFPPFRFSVPGATEPVRQSPYRTTPVKQAAIDKYVREMVEAGIAIPSISPWASPLIVVLQPDGRGGTKRRVCIDLRRVNAVCQPDGGSQALPLIVDLLDNVQGSTVFSTVDHASGYTQWAVAPEQRGLTAFVSHEGLFESTRLTFGVASAPAAYQRAMLALMSSLFRRKLVSHRPLVYIDDNLLVGRDHVTHLRDLVNFLRFMRAWRIALRQGKCAFFRKKVQYLGHEISAEGFQPLTANTDAVLALTVPQDVSQVRTFIGGIGHYRRFISNFADLAAPLHALTKKDVAWNWTGECQRSFEELRARMASAPILGVPRHDEDFTLLTDASRLAMGGVLQQKDKPVAYWSKSFNAAQKNYSATERELAAVVYALRHFYPYLGDRKFLLITDHSALRWLHTMRETANQRIATWMATINSFDFDVQHQPGRLLAPADMLSRLVPAAESSPSRLQLAAPVMGTEGRKTGLLVQAPAVWFEEASEIGSSPTSFVAARVGDLVDSTAQGDRRYELTASGRTIRISHTLVDDLPVISEDNAGTTNEEPFEEKEEEREGVSIRDLEDSENTGAPHGGGILAEQWRELFARMMFRYIEDGAEPEENELRERILKEKHRFDVAAGYLRHNKKPYLPRHLRRSLLVEMHDSALAGHPGVRNTYDKVLARFSWPGVFVDVRRHVQSCEACQRRKGRALRDFPAPPITARVPWYHAQIDCVGPFLHTDEGNLRVLTAVDVCSRYLVAVPLKTETAEEIAVALFRHVICIHGCPLRLSSDRGPAFISAVIAELCKVFEIQKVFSSGYRPQTCAAVERRHRTLEECISHYVSSNLRDWDRILPMAVFAINSMRHRITKFSPHELLFGRAPLLPSDAALHSSLETMDSEFLRTLTRRLLVARRIATDQLELEYARTQAAKDIPGARLFKEGDLVYAYLSRKRGTQGRLPADKLRSRWHGPFRISSVLDSKVYKLEAVDPELARRWNRRRHRTINVEFLKMAHTRDNLPMALGEQLVIADADSESDCSSEEMNEEEKEE
ncbi:MAG: RNase H-like domain-containing protein [Bacteroidota bacterium]